MGSAMQLNKIMDGADDEEEDPLKLPKDVKKVLEAEHHIIRHLIQKHQDCAYAGTDMVKDAEKIHRK